MEENKSGLKTGLGIVSLVVGIIALLVSFIPCLGALAIYIAPVSVIFGGYAFYIAKKEGQSTGLPLAGLIVAILALLIAGSQYYQMRKATDAMNNFNNQIYQQNK
jgi:hypothetical protein